jgi:hypothetical protein
VQKTLLDNQLKIKIERGTEGIRQWFITRLENHEHKADALAITDLFKNLFPVNEDLLKNVKCEDNLLIV